MWKLLLGCFLVACVGCQTTLPEPTLAEQVSGVGELRLKVKFDGARGSSKVYIDGSFVGEWIPKTNSDFAVYRLPAGLRTIRVESFYKEQKGAWEGEVLILGGEAFQVVEAMLQLE